MLPTKKRPYLGNISAIFVPLFNLKFLFRPEGFIIDSSDHVAERLNLRRKSLCRALDAWSPGVLERYCFNVSVYFMCSMTLNIMTFKMFLISFGIFIIKIIRGIWVVP